MKTLNEAMFQLSVKLPLEDNGVKKRFDRAYDIVRMLGSGYDISKTHYGYAVYKESTSLLEDNSVTYTIDEHGCSCPDNHTARAGLCKHRLAVMLLEIMQAE